MTTQEEAFLSALAKYTLFLDKSLFFLIDDLMRHTKLVLSGAGIMISEYPNPEELKREIKELKKLIEELGQEDWELKELLENWKRFSCMGNMVSKQQYCWVNISTTMVMSPK